MSSKQYVIMARSETNDNGLSPIGPRREIIDSLSRFNTGPDQDEATDVLYGPGIRIEFPPEEDPVRQMLITVTEEEIAWLVIVRLAKEFRWTIVDTMTGRALSP